MEISQSVVAVDIGGTNLRTGLVTPELTVQEFDMVRSADLLEVADPSRALLEHLERYVARFAAPDGMAPRAVAIGFPGTIDRTRRIVLSTSNIRSMQNLAIADFLEPALGTAVFIDRDVNMLLRHDMADHGLGGPGIVIGCYAGTGLGNAISINGEIHVGRHGVAGELGHIPTLGLDRRCGCGNLGCIETVASGMYLTAMAAREFPHTPLNQVFAAHSQAPQVRQFIRQLANPIAAEINILDPEAVILGGGVICAPGFPSVLLEDAIRDLCRKPLPAQDIRFLYSNGGHVAGVIGSAICAFDALAQVDQIHSLELQTESVA